MLLNNILLWIHLLTILGTFGGLLFMQLGLPAATRNAAEIAARAARLFNILIGVALLAGLGIYFNEAGASRGAHFNGVIGTKFAILVVVGGLLAMSKKSPKGDTFRAASIVLIAIAAFLGTSL